MCRRLSQVLSVRRFSEEEEAIATVNDTKYGLGNAGALVTTVMSGSCALCAE
jgi:acyl-CoA reductase-like NAD-dependent aldehyde dehydrogenase